MMLLISVLSVLCNTWRRLADNYFYFASRLTQFLVRASQEKYLCHVLIATIWHKGRYGPRYRIFMDRAGDHWPDPYATSQGPTRMGASLNTSP
jgi:hypothetical protein